MKGYSLEEAWDLMVSAKEAAREIRRHGLRWEDFVASEGLRPRYRGRVVLEWIGY